jgi:hypothetical protein
LNFSSALKNLPYYQAGMFASKWMAKRFGGGASELDPDSWGYQEYIKGALGAVAAGFVSQMVKPGSGQRVLEGGLNLMCYEMIQNEFIAPSEWAAGQFGAEEDEGIHPDYMGMGEDPGYLPGDVEEDEQGTTYMLGDDYEWRQLPETGMEGMGVLEPVGPLGQLEPVGPLGQLEPVGPLGDDDEYRKAILG